MGLETKIVQVGIRITSNEDGSAIVASLWMSLILALLGISLIVVSRDNWLEIRTEQNLDEAWLIAEGGLNTAIVNIARRRDGWIAREAVYEETIKDRVIKIHIASPLGKLDLNGATSPLLAELFIGLGYDSDLSAELADNIADFRDEDDFVRLNGAERQEYMVEGLDGPDNKPFENIRDLERVLKFAKSDVDCIAPFLTIYTGQTSIQPNFVQGKLRDILKLGEAPELIALGTRRTSLAGQVFEITASTSYSDHSDAVIRKVVRFSGRQENPIWVHDVERTISPNNYDVLEVDCDTE